jgi:predicted phage terminase large subunit-like protein
MTGAAALAREHELELEECQTRARQSLLNFTCYTKHDFEVNWHHRLLCRYLNAFVRGQISRLLIQAPPRHGKSELVSRRLPALILGQNPDAEVICATYNQKFASSLNRDVQRVMMTREYRELFPGTRLNERNIRTVADGTWLRNAEMFEVVGRKGKYVAAGTSGTLTGKGGDFAIIDDPVRGWEDAISATRREAVWEWYSSVLLTRLSMVNRICLTLTRWHEDDLAGRLLEKMRADPEADQWVIVNLPALKEGAANECDDDPREVGEALWPTRFPRERLLKVKSNNEQVFNSLFQQRPAPIEGNIIKTAWWKRFKTWPDRTTMDELLLSIDLPFKRRESKRGATDYAAFGIWGRRGADIFLLHVVRRRMGWIEQAETAEQLVRDWPDLIAKLVEAKANGDALIAQLRQEKVPGLIAVNPRTDKVNRAWAASPLVRAGNVWIPDASLASWVDEFVQEWAVFPAGANDDLVDMTTQALLYWSGAALAAAPVGFSKASAWLGADREHTVPWLSPAEQDDDDEDNMARSIALR